MILQLLTIGILYVGYANGAPTTDTGFFWHVTDMHWDPTYIDWGGSCGGKGPDVRGTYGEFACDSPLSLIVNAIGAMKTICHDPDFLIWTGDDTPHIYNDTLLNTEAVFKIIDTLTTELESNFPNKTFFSALGNHDWSPKNQFPGEPDPLYAQIADRWQHWLADANANDTFRKGGYYVGRSPVSNLMVVVLNTNLYYESDKLTDGVADPAGQLKWLAEQLTIAERERSKVMILGHVPPGMFEKHRNKHWFHPNQNEALLGLLRKHSGVIGSVHFAHHHTDSFRVLTDERGSPLLALLLVPAVTPWETTLPGVIGGTGNNPSVRLVEYDRCTGDVLNLHQYYLNLTHANTARPEWKLAYSARDYYDVSDFGADSISGIAEKMRADDILFQKYYQMNGVLYDPTERCEDECKHVHYCAITQLNYNKYEQCVEDMASRAQPRVLLNTSIIAQSILSLLLVAFFPVS